MDQLELPFAEKFEAALEEGLSSFDDDDFMSSFDDEPLACGIENPEICESCT